MRTYLLILLTLCSCTAALSQDIIVLRSNDQEINCRILSMNDSLVTYRLWQSPDTTAYAVKKFEVQSYLLDKKSKKSKAFSDKEKFIKLNPDMDLLGEYKTGTVVQGYVITNNNDSLLGFINITNVALNQVEINFMDYAGKVTLFSVKDAKAYGYAKIRYEKIKTGFKKEITNGHKTKDGYQFVHIAIEGPSKLYRFYTLHFRSSTMNSYDQHPPAYLGRLKREFVITNPKEQKVFTKGRTLKGALNRIYFDYPNYTAKYPVDYTKPSELPKVVDGFNSWYKFSQ